MSRTRSSDAWVMAAGLSLSFAVFVVLLVSGYSTLALTLLIAGLALTLGYVVVSAVLAPRRSRALRDRLGPAQLGAQVDLAALAATVNSGRPDAAKAAVAMVRRGFPRLSTADAIEVIGAAVPTPWPVTRP